MRGTVKQYSKKEGYGLIVDSKGNKISVNNTELMGFKRLKKGDLVNVEIYNDGKNQSVKVHRIASKRTKNKIIEKAESLGYKVIDNGDCYCIKGKRNKNLKFKTLKEAGTWINNQKQKIEYQRKMEEKRHEKTARIEYEKKYKKRMEELSKKANTLEYGEWCKKEVFRIIEEYGISDDIEYLKEEVFNVDQYIYGNISYTTQNILESINRNDYWNKSLYSYVYDDFAEIFLEKYKNINLHLDLEEGELFDLCMYSCNDPYRMFDLTLENIRTDELENFVMKLMEN